MASITTAEIAKLLAGEVVGDEHATLTGFAPAAQAKPQNEPNYSASLTPPAPPRVSC